MTQTATKLLLARPGYQRSAFVVRLIAGGVFVGFSFGKFVRHEAEAAALDRYGIPFPATATYFVGGLELVCGTALILGLLVRPSAFLLACNMAGAITTAGRVEGGPVHLVLAPSLLVGMLFLLWAGPGAPSVDGRLERRRASSTERLLSA